jgi:restriction system protein
MPSPRRPWRRLVRTILTLVAGTALAGWLAIHLILAWISRHPAVLAGGFVVAGIAGYLTSQRGEGPAQLRAPARPPSDDWLALSPGDFEEAVATLCRRDGCRDVRVTGGAGDLAADILTVTPTGRRMLVQCKRYAVGRRVGSPEVQRVGGTYSVVHGADLAIVVTTATFTPAAADYARQAGIRLVDAAELAAWAAGGTPPWGT